jgi:hypothetical protein
MSKSNSEEKTEREIITEFIDEHSIGSIIEVYVNENCFSEVVECLVAVLLKKLNALTEIQRVMNQLEGK